MDPITGDSLPLVVDVGESAHYAGEVAGMSLNGGLRLGDCILGGVGAVVLRLSNVDLGLDDVDHRLSDGWEGSSPLDDHTLFLLRAASLGVVVVGLASRRRNGGRLGAAWLDRGRGNRLRVRIIAIISGCRGASASSQLNNSGAGERVFRLGVEDVLVEDTGIGIRISTREADQRVAAWGAGSRALDVNLNARGVELGAALVVGKVQSNNLVTDEVTAGFEILGNAGRVFLSIHNILLEPVSVGLASSLIDLKPFGLRSIEFIAGGRTARGHVGHEGASVMWPLSGGGGPGEGDLAARVDIRNERCGLCTWAAHDILVGSSFNRIDRVDQTDGRCVGLSVRGVALVQFSINGELVDEAVCRDGGQHRGKEGDEGEKNGD